MQQQTYPNIRVNANRVLEALRGLYDMSIIQIKTVRAADGGQMPKEWKNYCGFMATIYWFDCENLEHEELFMDTAIQSVASPEEIQTLRDKSKLEAQGLFGLRNIDPQIYTSWEKRHLPGLMGGAISFPLGHNGTQAVLVGAGLPVPISHLMCAKAVWGMPYQTVPFSVFESRDQYINVVRTRGKIMAILDR